MSKRWRSEHIDLVSTRFCREWRYWPLQLRTEAAKVIDGPKNFPEIDAFITKPGHVWRRTFGWESQPIYNGAKFHDDRILLATADEGGVWQPLNPAELIEAGQFISERLDGKHANIFAIMTTSGAIWDPVVLWDRIEVTKGKLKENLEWALRHIDEMRLREEQSKQSETDEEHADA